MAPLQLSVFQRFKKALLLQLTSHNPSYIRDKPADIGILPPCDVPVKQVPDLPKFRLFDIRHANMDTRRAPVHKKVVSPFKMTDDSDIAAIGVAQNAAHNNPFFEPEYRNMSVMAHLPRPPWFYQADKIVKESEDKGIPAPFGKFDLNQEKDAHMRPMHP